LRSPYLTTTLGLAGVITLVAFEALAVTTAMPVVARDLNAVRDYGFAFSLFLTASLLGIVAAGSWCDTRGPAWPVRAGLVLFGAGLVVCGLATTWSVLLAGRAVAGLGGGLLTVANYVVIADVYPARLQPRMFAITSAAWTLPGLLGPPIAGWLVDVVSWRAVFLLVPVLTGPAALALLPHLRDGARSGACAAPVEGADRAGRRAGLGAGLVTGLLLVQWQLGGLNRRSGAGLVLAIAVVVAGFALMAGCFAVLTPPGTLRLARGLPSVILLRSVFAATYFGVESFVPLMLVDERGISPGLAGLALTGGALGWTAGSFLQARPGLRMPRWLLIVAGSAILGAGQIGLVLAVRPPAPALLVVPLWAVTALGMGMGTSGMNVLLLRLSAPGQEGRSSSALSLADALGTSLGIGLTGAAFAAWHHPHASDAALYTGLWITCGVVALAGVPIGFRVRTRGYPQELSPDPGLGG
jgi:MFS family permease